DRSSRWDFWMSQSRSSASSLTHCWAFSAECVKLAIPVVMADSPQTVHSRSSIRQGPETALRQVKGAEQPRAFWCTIFDAFRSDVRDARLRCPAAGDAACSPLHEGPETEEDGDQVDRPAHERHEVEERKRDQAEYQHAEACHAGLRL